MSAMLSAMESESAMSPLAEESGLIVEIDQWVMKTAMQQMYYWYNQGFEPGTLALNLTLTHLRRDNYISELQRLLKERYFRAEWLELEITENEVMKKFEEVITKLQLIHSMQILYIPLMSWGKCVANILVA